MPRLRLVVPVPFSCPLASCSCQQRDPPWFPLTLTNIWIFLILYRRLLPVILRWKLPRSVRKPIMALGCSSLAGAAALGAEEEAPVLISRPREQELTRVPLSHNLEAPLLEAYMADLDSISVGGPLVPKCFMTNLLFPRHPPILLRQTIPLP